MDEKELRAELAGLEAYLFALGESTPGTNTEAEYESGVNRCRDRLVSRIITEFKLLEAKIGELLDDNRDLNKELEDLRDSM